MTGLDAWELRARRKRLDKVGMERAGVGGSTSEERRLLAPVSRAARHCGRSNRRGASPPPQRSLHAWSFTTQNHPGSSNRLTMTITHTMGWKPCLDTIVHNTTDRLLCTDRWRAIISLPILDQPRLSSGMSTTACVCPPHPPPHEGFCEHVR